MSDGYRDRTDHRDWRNDPSECGHGGTIHLGRGFDAEKQCKLCGQKFDGLDRPVQPDTE